MTKGEINFHVLDNWFDIIGFGFESPRPLLIDQMPEFTDLIEQVALARATKAMEQS